MFIKHLKAVIIACVILFILFVIGFFSVNVIMRIIIGTGNEVMVPNIVGEHFDVARKKCMDLNLYVQEVEVQNSDVVPKNRIISQFPQANSTTKINRTIEVVVSQGPELVRVPHLDNSTEAEARLRLQNIGLHIGEIIYRYSNDVSRDRIIYSRPSADDMIPKGSHVSIALSLGELPDASERRDRYQGLLDDLD